MGYKILHQSKKSFARIGELETAHGKINTPVFMPVGTLGAVKTLSPEELIEVGAEIILSNTYHLYLRPGEKLIKKMGGLHEFIKWDKPILTDSGGYQVFSLGKNFQNPKSQIPNNLVKIKEDGVEFRSHIDGSKHFFSPEKVIDIQRDLDSDIMMVLDVCTEFPATHKRALETMNLTHAWAKRAVEYWGKVKSENLPAGKAGLKVKSIGKNLKPNNNSKLLTLNSQLLFGIVQGSTYKDLRGESTRYISSLPLDGIAVGGVSVGEGKKHMYDVMGWTGPNLPQDKPHYIMGIGEPEDVVEAVKNGFDMFDCVLPTRLARHGVVWTKSKQFSIFPTTLKLQGTSNFQFSNKSQLLKSQFQKLDLRKSVFRGNNNPIEKDCQCYTCQRGFSRAYLSHLIKEHEILGFRLTTIHNVHFMINLVKEIRKQILNGRF